MEYWDPVPSFPLSISPAHCPYIAYLLWPFLFNLYAYTCPCRSNSLGFTRSCTLVSLADLTAARFLSDVGKELYKLSANVVDLVARVNEWMKAPKGTSRNDALALRRCYADATPAFVRTYDAFAALKPALV